MVVHDCNSSTQKAETRGLLQVQGQLEPQNDSQASLGPQRKTLSQHPPPQVVDMTDKT